MKRERETGRGRERGRQVGRQRGRQADRQAGRDEETEKQKERYTQDENLGTNTSRIPTERKEKRNRQEGRDGEK